MLDIYKKRMAAAGAGLGRLWGWIRLLFPSLPPFSISPGKSSIPAKGLRCWYSAKRSCLSGSGTGFFP